MRACNFNVVKNTNFQIEFGQSERKKTRNLRQKVTWKMQKRDIISSVGLAVTKYCFLKDTFPISWCVRKAYHSCTVFSQLNQPGIHEIVCVQITVEPDFLNSDFTFLYKLEANFPWTHFTQWNTANFDTVFRTPRFLEQIFVFRRGSRTLHSV